MDNLTSTLQDPIERFTKQGYLVVENALSADQVGALNGAVDDYLEHHAQRWVHLSDSFWQTVNVLPDVADFDGAIENPSTLSLLRKIIGKDVSFEELSVMLRRPTENIKEYKGWHRDITRDYDRRAEIDAVSVVYYLTDVTESDHCFSIVPGTHRQRLDLKPEECPQDAGQDLLGKAGTAILFHARCIHAGRLKQGGRERRTIHIYYSHADKDRTSEWSDIPERLYGKVDSSLPPRLYSKWNVTSVFEGTGKKPVDLDPSMPIPEMLKEVQRRTKEAAGQP